MPATAAGSGVVWVAVAEGGVVVAGVVLAGGWVVVVDRLADDGDRSRAARFEAVVDGAVAVVGEGGVAACVAVVAEAF